MRRILFTFLLCLTAGSALLTACRHADDAWVAQRQALFRLIVSVHNSGQEEIARKLDSLNRTALPADRHARALWQLAQAWLTASQTNRDIGDSLLLPVVDYLTQHGAPGEQVEALLLHARSQEWRGEMEQAQHTYSQALQVALKCGDPHTEMRCRQLLTSFYLQRTHLKDEGAQTARRFLQLAEACRDTAALALARHALQPPGRRRGAFPPSHPAGCPGQRPILGDAEQIRTGRALHDPPATLRSPAAAEGNQRLPVQPDARQQAAYPDIAHPDLPPTGPA